MTAPKHLTVRGVPPELAKALDAERRRRGTSLNRTVIELLRAALGVARGSRRSNGLERLAGTWTRREHEDFEKATAVFEQVDEELWR
jgi:hypothetical protein